MDRDEFYKRLQAKLGLYFNAHGIHTDKCLELVVELLQEKMTWYMNDEEPNRGAISALGLMAYDLERLLPHGEKKHG